VSGAIASILVTEGQTVAKGTPLITIDDSVQRAVVEQQRSQSEAARASSRRSSAAAARDPGHRRGPARAGARQSQSAQDQYDKQNRLYEIDRNAVSKDAVDNANTREKWLRPMSRSRSGSWS